MSEARWNPRVSVIVPSHNHGRFVREAVESALSQDFGDLEVVVVDDCSTDDSVEVLREIADERVRVLANPRNVGTYATQNRAVDEARGELVAVLNSDDVWRPGKLSAQVALLERYPDAVLCYTLGPQIDAEGRELDVDQHAHWPRSERQDLFPLLLSSNRLLASSVMFRKGAVRFEESLRYSGDWVAWLALSERGEAVCLPEPLTAWRQHESNSYTRSQRVTLEEIRVRRGILAARRRWLKARRDKAAIKRGLSECAVDLTALYVLVGQMRLAKAAAGLAVRLAPANAVAHKRLVLSLMPSVVARRRLWQDGEVRIDGKELRSLAPLDLRTAAV